MQIIKECTPKFVVIRTDTYAHTLAHLDMLFSEALVDFPTLNRSDVAIVQYGGGHYQRTYGIEFPIPPDAKVPDTYQPITKLEYRL